VPSFFGFQLSFRKEAFNLTTAAFITKDFEIKESYSIYVEGSEQSLGGLTGHSNHMVELLEKDYLIQILKMNVHLSKAEIW
jgi:hypothetical protein